MSKGLVFFTAIIIFSLTACSAPDEGIRKGLEAYQKKNYAQALDWFSRNADLGRAAAQFYLGLMYEQGHGTRVDNRRAASLYRKAAEQNYPRAHFRLGLMHEEGRGVAQDYRQAAHWYRRAADHGIAAAQFNLGAMYDVGRGVGRDKRTALNWYRRAAEKGHMQAQFNLGRVYAGGIDVPRNIVSAHQWMNIAFALGYAPARARRDEYAGQMNAEQLLTAQKKAAAWLEKFEARKPQQSEWSHLKKPAGAPPQGVMKSPAPMKKK